MPSKWEYLFFMKLCFTGILMILGSIVYLFNMPEINTILSIHLRESLVVFIITFIFLWGCFALCFGSFRLIFSFWPGRALERIAVGKYNIISCSSYMGKAILILRQQKLHGKIDPLKLYSLPTRLVFGSDSPRDIYQSDYYQLIVDREQGQIFCWLRPADSYLPSIFDSATPIPVSESNKADLDYSNIGESVTDSSDGDCIFIDPDSDAED